MAAADRAHQQLHQVAGVADAEPRGRHREGRVLGCEADVGRQRQIEAAADARPVDARQQRLWHRKQRGRGRSLHQAVGRRRRRARPHRLELADIAPGAEGIAAAPHHEHAAAASLPHGRGHTAVHLH
eukprot:scaffold105534_cov42-Phaeocystis_antarctica.AAC.1